MSCDVIRMQVPVTLFALKPVCVYTVLTSMRRPVLLRLGWCGPWVSQPQKYIKLLQCVNKPPAFQKSLNSILCNSFPFPLTGTLGGPTSRRRKDQGFLGASHILRPDGGLKVRWSRGIIMK